MTKWKKAFSMLELVFVVVILGIVASVGAETIANVYDQYIIQRAQHRASVKTELASLQIANRLRYAIPKTVFRVRNDYVKEPIESQLTLSGDNYIGLQWVAYDGDSFEAMDIGGTGLQGWSGFCDLNVSNIANSIITPGSDLSLTNTIISNLSGGTKNITDAVVFFPYQNNEHNVTGSNGSDRLDLANDLNRTIAEQYRLAWSSYAVVVEGGDLILYHNFYPAPATVLGNNRSLLLKNVTTFKFLGTAAGIRFKICKSEEIGETDFNITACKEKVVF